MRSRVLLILCIGLVSGGCQTWISSSAPPDESVELPLFGDRDIVQPRSLAGAVEASGIDVRYRADQIRITFDRTIDGNGFCVDTTAAACCPSPDACPDGPSDVEVTNLTRGALVPLRAAQLLTPIAVLGGATTDVDEPDTIDPDLPGGSQPMRTVLSLTVDPTYVFASGETVEVRLKDSIRESTTGETMPTDAVVTFRTNAEDGVPPRVVWDSAESGLIGPHERMSIDFSEPVENLSVSIEPPLYGVPAQDFAAFARDGATGSPLRRGRTRSITFVEPLPGMAHALDEVYWVQILSEDCLIDGLGACGFVPTQDASGSELAGTESDTATTWIRRVRTAPVRIDVPAGLGFVPDSQGSDAVPAVVGKEFEIRGEYRPSLRHKPTLPAPLVTSIELSLLHGETPLRLGAATFEQGTTPPQFSLLAVIPADAPESIKSLNGRIVVLEAAAFTDFGTYAGADRIEIALDLVPPAPPRLFPLNVERARPSAGVCNVPLSGFYDHESTRVQLFRSSIPTVPHLLMGDAILEGGEFRFNAALTASPAGTSNPFGVTFFARAGDAAGNFSDFSEGVRVFCEDALGPSAPNVVDPPDGFATSDRSIRVSGTTSPGTAVVIVASGGAEHRIPALSNSFDSVIPVPATGSFELRFFAADAAGDRSTPVRRRVSSNPDPDLILLPVSGDGQVAAAGSTLSPFVVEARSAFDGTPLAGVPIDFALVDGAGTFPGGPNPIVLVTNASGQASLTLTLSALPSRARVRASSIRSLTAPLFFSGTGLPSTSFSGPVGSPFALQPVGGNFQSGEAGNTLKEPFAVVLTDATGRVIPNATVYFKVSSTLVPDGGWQAGTGCAGTGALLACAVTDNRGVARVSAAFRLAQQIPAATATAVMAREGDAFATLAQHVRIRACLDPATCETAPVGTTLFAVSLPGQPTAGVDCPLFPVTTAPCGDVVPLGHPTLLAGQAPRVRVTDAFGNPVANVGVDFSGATQGAAFYDFDDTQCGFGVPHLDDGCGFSSILKSTDSFGYAAVSLLFGRQDGADYTWSANGSGVSVSAVRRTEDLPEGAGGVNILSMAFPEENLSGAAATEQEQPWAASVKHTECLVDPDQEACDWSSKRAVESLEFTADGEGKWLASTLTSKVDQDLTNHYVVGTAPTQSLGIMLGTVSATFRCETLSVEAQLVVGALRLERVTRDLPVVDTFGEENAITGTILYSRNADVSPKRKRKPVEKFDGKVILVEKSQPSPPHYDGGFNWVTDLGPPGTPDETARLIAVSDGKFDTRVRSLADRLCEGTSQLPTDCRAPKAAVVFARIYCDESCGLADHTDLALIPPLSETTAVSVEQWRDVSSFGGASIPDFNPDWADAKLRMILGEATQGEIERETLRLVQTVTSDLNDDDRYAKYELDQLPRVIRFNLLYEGMRLNSSIVLPVSYQAIPDLFEARHFMRAAARHEARHAWQDVVRYKCPPRTDGSPRCVKNLQPDGRPNDSDGDRIAEIPFRLKGSVIDGQEDPQSQPGLRSELRDPDDTNASRIVSYSNTRTAIDQWEINAFDFWTCLEPNPPARCTP